MSVEADGDVVRARKEFEIAAEDVVHLKST